MNDQPFDKNKPTVFTKDGHHMIMLPNGDTLHGMIFNRVTTHATELSEAIIKILVNVAANEEEARKLYNVHT